MSRQGLSRSRSPLGVRGGPARGQPRRAPLLLLALAGAAGVASVLPGWATARADPPAAPPPPPTAPAPTPSQPAPSAPAAAVPGAADFLAVAQVLQSPRCQNCHPSDGVPHVGDAGRRHRMGLTRRSMATGLPCTTCHRGQNTELAHGPPGVTGVPGWRMPPLERPMVFDGMTPRALCEQLKDPARNGGKSLEALREHFASDPLVLWAWSPGPGRTVPPLTHAELQKHVSDWIAAGAPCPG